MDLFVKCTFLALTAVMVYPILANKDKSFAMLMGLCGCAMILIGAVRYLDPVMDLLDRLQEQSSMNHSVFTVLLKMVGLGLVAEIASLICTDAGNTSLGKSITIVASAAILWMSIPLMQELLDLICEIVNFV